MLPPYLGVKSRHSGFDSRTYPYAPIVHNRTLTDTRYYRRAGTADEGGQGDFFAYRRCAVAGHRRSIFYGSAQMLSWEASVPIILFFWGYFVVIHTVMGRSGSQVCPADA